MLWKAILSLFLLLSAVFVLYYPIRTSSELPNSEIYNEARAVMNGQIAGFSCLYFVIFLLIWSIPTPKGEAENEQKQEKKEEQQQAAVEPVSVGALTEEQKEALKDGTYVKEEELLTEGAR